MLGRGGGAAPDLGLLAVAGESWADRGVGVGVGVSRWGRGRRPDARLWPPRQLTRVSALAQPPVLGRGVAAERARAAAQRPCALARGSAGPGRAWGPRRLVPRRKDTEGGGALLLRPLGLPWTILLGGGRVKCGLASWFSVSPRCLLTTWGPRLGQTSAAAQRPRSRPRWASMASPRPAAARPQPLSGAGERGARGGPPGPGLGGGARWLTRPRVSRTREATETTARGGVFHVSWRFGETKWERRLGNRSRQARGAPSASRLPWPPTCLGRRSRPLGPRPARPPAASLGPGRVPAGARISLMGLAACG